MKLFGIFSLSFFKFLEKFPVLKSLFNRVAGLQVCSFTKARVIQLFTCRICAIFKNTYFEVHLQKTTSEICFFTWTAIFHTLHFQLKLLPVFQFCNLKLCSANFSYSTIVTAVRSSRPVVFCQKVYLQVLQNSQENICAIASFFLRRCFLVNFEKFSSIITPFLKNHSDGCFCI